MQYNQPVFDKFFNEDDAENYKALFISNGLHAEVEPPRVVYDAIIGSAAKSNEYYLLRLPPEEFAAAKEIIAEEVKRLGIPDDNYLREMSDEELKAIVYNEDDWSREDYAAAKLLLHERAVAVNENEIISVKEAGRNAVIRKRTISFPVLTFLYLISPLGMLVPVVAGIIIYTMKDYDRDGVKHYVYSEGTRKNGLVLLAIGILSTLWWAHYIGLF